METWWWRSLFRQVFKWDARALSRVFWFTAFDARSDAEGGKGEIGLGVECFEGFYSCRFGFSGNGNKVSWYVSERGVYMDCDTASFVSDLETDFCD